MTKEEILQLAKKHGEEARRHAEKARKAGKPLVEFTLKSGETSLGKMIRTKYQADLFMKLLKGL